ncbi:MAG TPA: ABC transporter permease, partial [Thermoplasmata archaeon]|nr:ABC transporter permease [Thermoplasmata archaeon]
ALSSALASELGVAPGSQVAVRYGAQKFHLNVVAAVSALPGLPGTFSPNARVGDGALVSLATLESVTGTNVGFGAAFLKLVAGAQAAEVSRQVRAVLVSHLAVHVLTTEEALEALREDAAFVQVALDHVFSMLTTVAVFSLVTGLYASVLERDFEIGVLKVLGLRKRNIGASLMLEGTAIAFVAVTVGIAAGLAVGFGLVWWLNLFSPLQLDVALPLVPIALVYASTLSSSLLSTFFTARWSAKREAVDQMARRE